MKNHNFVEDESTKDIASRYFAFPKSLGIVRLRVIVILNFEGGWFYHFYFHQQIEPLCKPHTWKSKHILFLEERENKISSFFPGQDWHLNNPEQLSRKWPFVLKTLSIFWYRDTTTHHLSPLVHWSGFHFSPQKNQNVPPTARRIYTVTLLHD